MIDLDEILQPLLGRPAWLVRHGHGSFITLEFGDPYVDIGEPRGRTVRLTTGDADVTTRPAVVHGAWHLWIYCCEWTLSFGELDAAHSESRDIDIARALGCLDGQSLEQVEFTRTGSSVFTFDLGGELRTAPYATTKDEPADGEPDEQWMLFRPGGRVLTFRGDGTVAEGPGAESRQEEDWHALEGDRTTIRRPA